jgi:nucleoside-diphosphate kinase
VCYRFIELIPKDRLGSKLGPFFWNEERDLETTLLIIKPDAVRRNLIGRVLASIEEAGLRILAMKMVDLSEDDAGAFYEVHRGKPFYAKLVSYMSSGSCVVAVLQGEDAIRRLRLKCGATDPSKAQDGTIRAAFGISITMNSVHASDSSDSAAEEVRFFVPDIS